MVGSFAAMQHFIASQVIMLQQGVDTCIRVETYATGGVVKP